VKKLVVVVTTPPYSNLTRTALAYIEAAIVAGVDVIGVFFYQDGVINANQGVAMPNDEFQAINAWQALNAKHQIPLHLCVSSGEKRGLSDEQPGYNIAPGFSVSGLGELVELSDNACRVVQL
jgi:tRNA 2-thiouridine synthesizing protein D